jgi:hypothetical protein
MKKKAIRKYLIEAFLIVFSVSLALFLNKIFEDKKVRKQQRIARESLVRELTHNLRVTEQILPLHKSVLKRVDSISTVSAASDLYENRHFDLSRLTNGKSLMQELLTSTAWETARSTGIIAEFDYNEVEILTNVYGLQDVILNKTMGGIVELFFKPETHDSTNVEATLLQLRLRFNELVGQEYLLIESYNQALRDLEKRK